MNETNQRGRAEPMTPGLRNLLQGGATSFLQGKIPLKGIPPRQTGGATAFLKGEVPLQGAGGPQTGPVQTLTRLGSPVSTQQTHPLPLLGQQQSELPQAPSAMISPPPQTPATPATGTPPVQYRKCPGPIELPDGRVIEPDDFLKLNDICEIMPFLLEAMGAATGKNGLAPGQSVPVVGQTPSGAPPVPGFPSFGPSQGPFGGGGGAMFGGGGGGGPGPQGIPGPAGAPGLAGLGGKVKTATKVDGTFSAGPGMFVPVPGTEVKFTTSQDGAVLFMLHAILGAPPASDASQNTFIGIRINGTDHPLTPRLLHTFAGGVGEFTIGQDIIFPIELPAGDHTAEVILRGINPGEFGGGLGTAGNVMAQADAPLILSAVFS